MIPSMAPGFMPLPWSACCALRICPIVSVPADGIEDAADPGTPGVETCGIGVPGVIVPGVACVPGVGAVEPGGSCVVPGVIVFGCVGVPGGG
jgi:hypothetical protein